MFSMSRRAFVTSTLAGAAALGDFGFLKRLAPLSAEDVKVTPDRVQFSPDVEPLVRLIEETDRDKLLNVIVDAHSRRHAAISNCSPRRDAGRRARHPAAAGRLQVPRRPGRQLRPPRQPRRHDRDRWLPLFWAIDNFKDSQAPNVQEGRLDDGRRSTSQAAARPTRRRSRFIEAMDNWDEEAADRAVAGPGPHRPAPTKSIEMFWRYGARDFRDIGHKAIYVANAWRTLQTIGWRHAEPILRSLAYALLEHEGTTRPSATPTPTVRAARILNASTSSVRTGPSASRARKRRPSCWPRSAKALRRKRAIHRAELLNKEVDPAVTMGRHIHGRGRAARCGSRA